MSRAAHTAPPRFAGLVLAAGRSRRMGALKQTLPWPDAAGDGATTMSTIVAASHDAIAPWCRLVVVVVGTDRAAVVKALGDRVFTRIDGDSEAPMFGSICLGLRAIAAVAAGKFDAVILQPGDHPGASRATMETLLAAHVAQPQLAIMPEHHGKGGHPVIIPMAVVNRILAWSASGGEAAGGLRQFWIEHPDLHRRVPVDDPSCVIDINTPEEYESAILARQSGRAGF